MEERPVIGVDIGGTFTDAIAVTRNGMRTAKVPSDPAHPESAVLKAIHALDLDAPPARVLHSTTLVTNMLLERKGARVGFITTQGCRDVVHIGRHKRPLNYAIRQEIPQQHYPPVRRRRRLTVPERLAANGEVVEPLDERAVDQAVERLLNDGVEAIAIGFLHAYRNAQHERRAKQRVEAASAEVFVCASHEVSPRFREYERFMTTIWNARVAPAAAAYLRRLMAGLRSRYGESNLTMLNSNGGLETIRDVSHPGAIQETPIRLALSGPAAASSAVSRAARDMNLPNCVGLDVGGTSADVVVVRDGRVREAPLEESVLGGYALQCPMLDLHTIGAGGGSIVKRDAFGVLHVGPASAGALPGPACYGRGGRDPTLTDAAVVTGRLPPTVQLAGSLALHAERAVESFTREVATSAEQAVEVALDALALAETNIAFAVRERTVARGLDPAELALVAAGGAGGLLACGVAHALEIPEVVVPPYPGLLAAWGLLSAPERREQEMAVLRLVGELSAGDLQALRSTVADGLPEPPSSAAYRYQCSLRYLGQGFEVSVPLYDEDSSRALESRFHEAHQREYGFALPGAAVEWVALRAAWEVKPMDWAFPDEARRQVSPTETTLWTRTTPDVAARKSNAPVYPRETLEKGGGMEGPAIVTESDSTVYVPRGWVAQVARHGYMRIRSQRNP